MVELVKNSSQVNTSINLEHYQDQTDLFLSNKYIQMDQITKGET